MFICAAGLAAHLAGAVAAHTTRPVIGVPMDGGPLSGFDALLSTVQMPGGVPVATVAIGKAGAKNAGYLAAQILSLNDGSLSRPTQRGPRKQSRVHQTEKRRGPGLTQVSVELHEAIKLLRDGGIICHACEGVWGFACDPFNQSAVRRILEIKQRPQSKGLIVIADEVAQV